MTVEFAVIIDFNGTFCGSSIKNVKFISVQIMLIFRFLVSAFRKLGQVIYEVQQQLTTFRNG